jgi:hypothetical protein
VTEPFDLDWLPDEWELPFDVEDLLAWLDEALPEGWELPFD